VVLVRLVLLLVLLLVLVRLVLLVRKYTEHGAVTSLHLEAKPGMKPLRPHDVRQQCTTLLAEVAWWWPCCRCSSSSGRNQPGSRSPSASPLPLLAAATGAATGAAAAAIGAMAAVPAQVWAADAPVGRPSLGSGKSSLSMRVIWQKKKNGTQKLNS
jgi:hypothetical protein